MPVDPPSQIESAQAIDEAPFALALGFIYQGGRITVPEAAQIGGMGERVIGPNLPQWRDLRVGNDMREHPPNFQKGERP